MTATTVNTQEANAVWGPEIVPGMVAPTIDERELPVRRRRVRGLRITVVPSGPLVCQVLGGAAVLAGVWGQWGVNIAAIVGGAGAAVLGMLKEAGKI